ncbi:hypothetical protein BDW59DRAFT_120069 [Aspergillus cavernicola]|uniref:HNH nuclease domain-containing protein n=1 Tax=Aspergillus cavernicola TaxID=176166 RepID=A0ABR4HWH8_9EURO
MMSNIPQLHHRSSLEGVLFSSSQPLNPGEHDLAIHIFNNIIQHFESSQATDSGYKPVSLIRLMKEEVSEKDEFLKLFYSFLQQDLLEELSLENTRSHLAGFSNWSAKDTSALRDSLYRFAQYLVDNFFLPLKALAAKTPQPTPALSHSTISGSSIPTQHRVSTLRRDCLVRDRHRCVVTRAFDAQEVQARYRQSQHDVKDDDGNSLIPERGTMKFLEVAHIIPHSLMSARNKNGETELVS